MAPPGVVLAGGGGASGRWRWRSKSVTRAQGNLSAVDVGAVDAERFPLFAEAAFEDTVLGPGDMLFIPNRWWHYVRSLSVSASCNFWF